MIARLIDRFGRWLTDRHAKAAGPFLAEGTAVLVLAPQNDVFESDGAWSELCQVAPSVEHLSGFLAQCRAQGWQVIHSPMSWRESERHNAINQTRHLLELQERGLMRHGTSGAELVGELQDDSDFVLPERQGLNAFTGTGLIDFLRNGGRHRLIVVGGVINADLDSSARAAIEHDFDVTIVSDLVAAYDEYDWHNTIRVTLRRLVNRVMKSEQILASGPSLRRE